MQPNEPTNSIYPTIVEKILPPNLLDQNQNDPLDQVLMNEIRIYDEMFRENRNVNKLYVLFKI